MNLPRRRLLELGLSALGAGLTAAPVDALAKGHHHAAGLKHHAHNGHRHVAHGVGPRLHGRLHPAPALARYHPPARPLSLGEAPRRVKIHNLHTDEKLDAVYFDNGEYVPDALHAVNHVLRDFRTGDVHHMDPGLLDLLVAVSERTESRSPVYVISGYRSPRTNAFLRAEGGAESGVARKSLHMEGQAIDLRLADVSLGHLRKAALSLGRGGVGYYPISNFVHVDVGPVRQWGGI